MVKKGIIIEHNKKLFIAIIVLTVLFVLVVFVSYKINKNSFGNECQTDSDCVPASCCHATSCVPSGESPDCSDIFCTQECQSGTLDCNQGSCGCVNGRCSVFFG